MASIEQDSDFIKDDEKMDVLVHFTMPKCKLCGTVAEIVQANDSGCNDPECCGGRQEWTELRCPKCIITENLKYINE